MARKRTISSIEKEIQKVKADLEKARGKVREIEAELEKLQDEKQEYEMKQMMDALQNSGKSIQDVMNFINAK